MGRRKVGEHCRKRGEVEGRRVGRCRVERRRKEGRSKQKARWWEGKGGKIERRWKEEMG